MTTQFIRNEVWQNYLDASRLTRYYSALADRYRLIYKFSNTSFIRPLLTGVLLLFDSPPEFVGLFIQLVNTLPKITNLIFNFSNKARVLNLVSQECGSLENEYEDLWLAMESGDLSDGEIREKINQIKKKLIEIINIPDDFKITINHKLNEKCAIETYRAMEEKYEHSA